MIAQWPDWHTALTRPREIITVDAIIKIVASYYGLKPATRARDRSSTLSSHVTGSIRRRC